MVVVLELVVELEVVDEVLEDVVGVVVDDVLELVVVDDEVLVVVVDSHWHWELQTWPSGHRSAPDGELGSHSSPVSTTPLPHLPCVVVVDDVVVVELVVVFVVEVVVTVVVLVGLTSHSGARRNTRSLSTVWAKNAPSRFAPTVSSSSPFGAQMTACACALREMRTLGPSEKMRTSHGVTAPDSGPTKLPLSNLMTPVTLICTGPRASSCALRPILMLQKVYEPGSSVTVPGPCPPPATIRLPHWLGCGVSVRWPPCGTVTDSLPQAGNGDGAPHAAARFGMIGVGTGVAGPHDEPESAELASSSSQVDLGWSCTVPAAMVDAGALTCLVDLKRLLAPRSPELTTSPLAFSESLAKSTKSPNVGAVCAHATSAHATTAKGRASHAFFARLMSVPLPGLDPPGPPSAEAPLP